MLSKTTINNPILRGFNPDPSIIRVEDDYFIATSTFEWFPGVQIHHSKDLKNWTLLTRPLNRVKQLDMLGIPNSGGVWAPCLSYDKGIFYLLYTIVLNHDGILWNMHNYLVTSKDIGGEWSDPIYLNSDGFDPSLFHDEDGKKWVVNRCFDYRKSDGGISLQEFSVKEGKLVGDAYNIFCRSSIGDAEGPHLYKINGYYYLIVAEGGTGLGHCVTFARSKNIKGPYEIDPNNPMLTSRDNIALPLQKAGHADIVQTQKGEWYMVHLCGRPMPSTAKCVLGRETCIQKVEFSKDGWLRLSEGGREPLLQVQGPELDLIDYLYPKLETKDDFNSESLNINFQTLRVPHNEDSISLTERPGYLRLKGREFLNSKFHQSLVARRQQAFSYTATTCVEFEPNSFKQMAGLTCYYNTMCFYYLKISWDEHIGKYLEIMSCDDDNYVFPVKELVSIDGWDKCYLRAEVDYKELQFSYSENGTQWSKIGPILDASILSDEHIRGWAFTGAFVGLCCQDLTGKRKPADFDFFEYIER